ncbi:MAG: hypothetical protein EXQ77_05945, partial [Thermoleophilia bacterium]|nr:hypothetical protein [Thermoleophilia bacterium]
LADGVSFEGLHAVDARGIRLPVRFVEAAGGFAIRVDDRRAVYPVTVDPWVQAGILTKTGAAASDLFGYSVAVSGDTVVVGAYAADPGGVSNAGAAYVFTSAASDTSLGSLSVAPGSLSPVFVSGTTSYAVSLRGSSVTVAATATDANASLRVRVGNGPWGAPRALPLNTGRNTVEVRVTAEDGSTTRTYTLTVTREPSRAGYCLNGRFYDLEQGQPDSETKWAGATPALYVHGKGIMCDTPPWATSSTVQPPSRSVFRAASTPTGARPSWRSTGVLSP